MKVATEAQDWDVGFDGHRRAQIVRGLELSPAERLRWLEQTVRTLRRWQQRASASPGSRCGR